MADAVRGLFDSFQTEEDLDRAVAESREENPCLEFKAKQDNTHGNLHKDDKWNFSKTVSAFANSEGGVLIFGIKSAKSSEAPDHAHALKPIVAANGFLAKLQDLLLGTTQPVVDDVEFRHIPSVKVAGAGYVTCLVPASDKQPHRAMQADREYYRRTTNGCRKLEHLDLEDMFGRRPRPLLRPFVELRPRPEGDPHEELHVFFINEGRAVARFSGFLGQLLDPEAVVVGGSGGINNLSAFNSGAPFFGHDNNEGVIHPNGIAFAQGYAILKRSTKGARLKLHLKWYCDGMQAKSAELDLGPGVRTVVK